VGSAPPAVALEALEALRGGVRAAGAWNLGPRGEEEGLRLREEVEGGVRLLGSLRQVADVGGPVGKEAKKVLLEASLEALHRASATRDGSPAGGEAHRDWEDAMRGALALTALEAFASLGDADRKMAHARAWPLLSKLISSPGVSVRKAVGSVVRTQVALLKGI
ncbi:hypothetical protein H632_c3351p0, partial [Helicosporidium sp. ATCC 50920]